MEIIRSNENKNVKLAKSLCLKKFRDINEMFLLEGVRAIEDAVSNGVELLMLFYSENFDISRHAELEKVKKKFALSEKLFADISETKTPQGVIAIASQPQYYIKEVLKNSSKVIVLEKVQDPGNMGTIIRTADAAGFDAVILVDGCTDVFGSKVVRSTMGSLFRMPICTVKTVDEVGALLKEHGFNIFVTHLDGEMIYNSIDYSAKNAFVFGNEGSGVSDAMTGIADKLIKIPMLGGAESLNVSVAAAVVMYEDVRSRVVN